MPDVPVSDADWNSLQPDDQSAIAQIITGNFGYDYNIVPVSGGTPMQGGGDADSYLVSNPDYVAASASSDNIDNVCMTACGTAYGGAVAACAALTFFLAPFCIAAATIAAYYCRKGCVKLLS